MKSATSPPSIDLLDHKKTLRFIDLIFGGYCSIMIAVSAVSWAQGESSFRPMLAIGVFVVFNISFSELSKRQASPRKLELVRSAIGPFVCVWVFLCTQELFGGWWTGFLIMCLGGNMLHSLLSGHAVLGRVLVIVNVVALVLTILLSRPNHDWYMMTVYVGAIAISGLLFVEVLAQLSRTLSSMRISKDEIAGQKAQVEEQRAIIERKSVELESTYLRLIDSIRYAKRIQTSLLPLEERIRKEIPGFFVLNRPKEIVSGDFYWFASQGPYYFLAVADCTGHGVPGAMMTVIGNSMLNKIINENKTVEPAQVLEQVDQFLLETIQRHEVDEEAFTDGMDLALLRIHKETGALTFAGAKRPMIVIENGNLHLIKGDRFSIGWSLSKEKKFTQQTYQATEGTLVYLFTDGYGDQFGMKINKKLGRGFHEILLEISKKEMYEQHFMLDRKLKLWRSTTPQTDDVMVAGISFSHLAKNNIVQIDSPGALWKTIELESSSNIIQRQVANF
jgi:serine phosphatase RsbU (regulator of sigma subunit)